MSKTDKIKFNGIEEGANKTTVDSSLSSSSTNPVQNKIVQKGLSFFKCGATISSLADFVAQCEACETYGRMGRVKDSNSVLPGGSGWKRFIALGQNASTTTGSVGYQVLIMVSGNIWHCYLDGNSTNGYTLKYSVHLADSSQFLPLDEGRDITIDGSHKLLLGSGSIYGSGTTLGFRPNNNDFTYGMNLWNANNTAWCLSPNTSKMLNLGGPDYLWNTIYAFAGTIQTSDRREKHNIEDLEDNMIDFLMDLNPIIYRLNDKPEKLYSGLIAQDVEETMIEHNIPSDFGLLDKSPVYDEEENIIDYKYGLTYEQLIPILIKTIQNQEIRINKLEQLLKNKF